MKKHALKFTCGELINRQGWAVNPVESTAEAFQKKHSITKTTKEINPAKQTIQEDIYTDKRQLKLKSDIVIFYLGRIAFYKIEKIEDSLKSFIDQFWEQDRAVLKKLFLEAINVLSKSNHVVIENGKTYIPLKRN